jgi:hypothetical protein
MHHNGGHGYNRKLKGGAPQPGVTVADSEFVIDFKKLSVEEQPVDKRTTLMVSRLATNPVR